ncbi:hypothetical protein K6119_15610 [Paracrocinitomix mangrovi]|uniref:hypothetical protein n=1 Tax=Paracrocinitomix mangrovi TaxID=2862509 RepID=UPI001C8E3151|nr:hypothetical protein [Paracrocinitomix mangrovi]UKN01156.1 hypothetical protein K6119_15610 [Paracrocinitomix mangrovi]
MDQLLVDYKAYYKARMDRWEGNPLYPNSYQSEKALFEAMNSCNELIEFKDKIGDLNIKNAIALVIDKETARLKHFEELQETVRALGPKFTLERIGNASTDIEVAQIATEAEHEAMILISVDLMIDHFYSDIIPRLETLQMLKTIEGAEKYQSDIDYSIQEEIRLIKENVQLLEDNAQNWQQGWKFNPDLVWEFRHRRKIPLPDEVLQKRMNEYKTL